MADLLGKEAAVLLPSGTMCNEIALGVHCNPGDEVIAQGLSHIINYEAGGPAALSGVMARAVDGPHGRLPADAVRAAVRAKKRGADHEPRRRRRVAPGGPERGRRRGEDRRARHPHGAAPCVSPA